MRVVFQNLTGSCLFFQPLRYSVVHIILPGDDTMILLSAVIAYQLFNYILI